MARTSTSLVQPQAATATERRAYTVTGVVADPVTNANAKSFAVHGREEVAVVADAPEAGEGYDWTPWGFDIVSEKWVALAVAATVAPETTARAIIDTRGCDRIAIEIDNLVGGPNLTATNAIWLYQIPPARTNV